MDTLFYSIRGGDLGTADTLRHMARWSLTGSVSPDVRDTAAQIVQGLPRDGTAHARAIAHWLRSRCQFLNDPTHFEGIVPPGVVLDKIRLQGFYQGDCDDVAVVAAALGLSIGLAARFVVVGFRPGIPYQHVWTELADSGQQQWVAIDPTRPATGMPRIVKAATFQL